MNAPLLVTWLLLAANALPAAADTMLPDPALAERAIETLPQVRAAQARLEESRARGDALEAGPYGLQVNLSPMVRNEQGGPSYSEWEASLTRRLRLPDKAALDRALGEAGTEAAALAVDDARHMGARMLLEHWTAWLRAALATRLAQDQRDALAAERDAIAARVSAGDLARLDLDRVSAELAAVEVDVARQRLAREQARLALNALFPQLGVPPSVPAIPPPQAALPDPAATVARIVSRSHEIGIALAIARQQRLSAERAGTERWSDPTVGVRVLDEANHDEQALGLVFSWAFPTAADRATAVAAGHLAAARLAEADAVRRDIERGARQLLQALPDRIAAWRAAEAALTASSAALSRVEHAFALGEAGFSDLSLARRQQREAAELEVSARLDVHETRLAIDIDSHELWARHLHEDEHEHASRSVLDPQ